MNSRLIVLCLILLAGAILGSTYIATEAYKQIKFGKGSIIVKGCAEKEIQSDFATWHGSISSRGQNQLEAYDQLQKDVVRVREFFGSSSVPFDQINFQPIATTVIYKRNEQGYSTNTPEAYELSLSFSIAHQNIAEIARISEQMTTLIKDGVSVYSSQPQYFYRKMEEIKIDMLAQASADAMLRAEALISMSGESRVGALRSAQQGVFQITPAFSTSVSDYGEFDTGSIAKKIRAVVTMEYAID